METPARNIRIPDNRWERAKVKASGQGRSRAEVVNALLDVWLADDPALDALVSAFGTEQPSGHEPPGASGCSCGHIPSALAASA